MRIFLRDNIFRNERCAGQRADALMNNCMNFCRVIFARLGDSKRKQPRMAARLFHDRKSSSSVDDTEDTGSVFGLVFEDFRRLSNGLSSGARGAERFYVGIIISLFD